MAPDRADTDASRIEVVNNDALDRFEIRGEDQVAFLRYEQSAKRIILIHTEVPNELAGQGIGGKLAAFALDYARAHGLRVVPKCPYVAAYIDRHLAYADLVEHD